MQRWGHCETYSLLTSVVQGSFQGSHSPLHQHLKKDRFRVDQWVLGHEGGPGCSAPRDPSTNKCQFL